MATGYSQYGSLMLKIAYECLTVRTDTKLNTMRPGNLIDLQYIKAIRMNDNFEPKLIHIFKIQYILNGSNTW